MYPRLFTIGSITVYSFGLMLGIGFFVASLVLHKETIRKNISLDFSNELLIFLRTAYITVLCILVITYLIESGMGKTGTAFDTGSLKAFAIPLALLGLGYVLFNKKSRSMVTADTSAFIVLLSIIAGISGSKLLYVLENMNELARAPFETIFSPGGLTWYGGFFLVVISLYFFTRNKSIPFLQLCDASSPALMIGYGISRLGCHLAGDGDYGMPTTLPWATSYAKGTYPPSIAFKDFPEIVQKYGVNGVVPDTILVHPAPVYECIAGIALFFVLWKLRTKLSIPGQLFMMYLILAGSARLAVEFIRLNPRLLFGLSEAQLLSSVMILAGIVGFFYLKQSHLNLKRAVKSI